DPEGVAAHGDDLVLGQAVEGAGDGRAAVVLDDRKLVVERRDVAAEGQDELGATQADRAAGDDLVVAGGAVTRGVALEMHAVDRAAVERDRAGGEGARAVGRREEATRHDDVPHGAAASQDRAAVDIELATGGDVAVDVELVARHDG